MDKIYNDCIHGHIRLPAVCSAIIDTPCFQRLRNIKQIGVGYYVFPSACHNRFEHSLGVCYLTGLMVDTLNKNAWNDEVVITKKEKICLQIAALCHDLGHGPFSHTWEKFIKEVSKTPVDWTHERSSVWLLRAILQEEKVKTAFSDENLDSHCVDLIEDLIVGYGPCRINVNERAFLFEIVNNQFNGIDVDKWDYILRDGHMMNLRVHFDYQRLMEFARVLITDDNKYHICYRDKEAVNIFYMFQARAELHYLAYTHRVVKVIEQMLVDALVSAHTNGYAFQECDITQVHRCPSVYEKMTDHIMYDIMYSKGERLSEARSLLRRIHCRDFYQHIATISPAGGFTERKFWTLPQSESCLPLLVLYSDMKIDRKLLDEVYIFEKSDVNKAKHYRDWTNAPVFPLLMDNMERKKVFIFSRMKYEGEKLKDLKLRLSRVL